MNIPSIYGSINISDDEYDEIMEKAYKDPDYLSPHDMNSGLDDYGVPIEEEFTDYVDLRTQNLFVGVYPLDTIYDGIEGQFQDYMNIEDSTNYVDIFYVQLANSITAVKDDENEIHKEGLLNKLDDIKEEFVYKVKELFETRLTISILAEDDESTPEVDEQEIVIRKMYEFFILNARKNFYQAITLHMIGNNNFPEMSDNEFINTIEMKLSEYSPFVTCMTPTSFLNLCNDTDIKEYYEEGKVSGNFLRKYSPKFYQNEDLKVEIITAIMALDEQQKLNPEEES